MIRRDKLSSQTAQFFSYLGSLQFHKCMKMVQKYQQKVKKSKMNTNEELISSLRRFVACENMYYTANYSTTKDKDVCSRINHCVVSNHQLLFVHVATFFVFITL
jgi:hypothetical protein